MAGHNCGRVTVGNSTPPRCGLVALLLLAALAPETAVAQRTPQPIFTELFAYDPTESLAVAGEVADLS
jgi:hypothetical protein